MQNPIVQKTFRLIQDSWKCCEQNYENAITRIAIILRACDSVAATINVYIQSRKPVIAELPFLLILRLNGNQAQKKQEIEMNWREFENYVWEFENLGFCRYFDQSKLETPERACPDACFANPNLAFYVSHQI